MDRRGLRQIRAESCGMARFDSNGMAYPNAKQRSERSTERRDRVQQLTVRIDQREAIQADVMPAAPNRIAKVITEPQ